MKAFSKFVLILSLASTAFAANERETRSTFRVRDPSSGEIYFTGTDQRMWREQSLLRETRFYDLKGSLVFQEVTELTRADDSLLSYRFQDLLGGGQTSLVRKDNEVVSEHQEEKSSAAQKARFAIRRDLLAPAQVEAFIQRNWEAILSKKTLEFEMIVPQRSASYGFEVLLKDQEERAGKRLYRIVMQPRNFLLRLLAPKLELLWIADPAPHMVLFRGPSPALIRGEKNRILDIEFSNNGFDFAR